jgi:hypothetical protein
MLHKIEAQVFQTSAEAIAASSNPMFTLTAVHTTHDNWSLLFEQCESIHRITEDIRLFIGLGWCVLLLPRIKKVQP